MRRLIVAATAALATLAAPSANASEIRVSIWDLGFDLIDMTPDDGVDPWVTGVPLDLGRLSFESHAASYTDFVHDSPLPEVPFSQIWNGVIGPNSALRFSFQYNVQSIVYHGFGVDEYTDVWLAAATVPDIRFQQWQSMEVISAHGAVFDETVKWKDVWTDAGQFDSTIFGVPSQSFDFAVELGLNPLTAQGLNVEPTISAVPEPSTWAMLLLGLAGIGAVGARRKKASAVGVSQAG